MWVFILAIVVVFFVARSLSAMKKNADDANAKATQAAAAKGAAEEEANEKSDKK